MRPINADELLTHLNACLTNGRPLSNLYDLSEIVSYVESMPTVDIVKHGRWINMADFEQCSVCTGTHLKEFRSYYGRVIWIKTNYCPNCGAKMDGEEQYDAVN